MQHIPCNSMFLESFNCKFTFRLSVIRKHHDTHISFKLYTSNAKFAAKTKKKKKKKKKKEKEEEEEEEEKKTKKKKWLLFASKSSHVFDKTVRFAICAV